MEVVNGMIPLSSAAGPSASIPNAGTTSNLQTKAYQHQPMSTSYGNHNNNTRPMRKRPYFSHQMNSKVLVPFTEIEWKYVQRRFNSDKHEDINQMCSLMNMWINRMQHDTPVFIGISELVFRALALDGKQHSMGQNSGKVLDNADIGLIYGSVIIRFVNYVNEICQPEEKLISIAAAVRKMNIPSWIVRLRHEATHAQMPPMNLMREAIKYCRHWLWRQHWQNPLTDAIKQTLPEVVEQHLDEQRNFLGNRILNALQKFSVWRRSYPSLTEFQPPNTQMQKSDKTREIIDSLLTSNPGDFISSFAMSCLAQGASDIDLDMFSKENGGPAGHLLDGTLSSRVKHIDRITGLEQKCYQPIFHMLNQKGCLPLLLVEIARLIGESSQLNNGHRRHLAGWADKQLDSFLRISNSISIQNWKTILKQMVMAPQYFRDKYIKSLMDILKEAGSIEEKRLSHLHKLLKIRDKNFGGISETEKPPSESDQSLMDCSTYSVKTLADLQSRIQQENDADTTFTQDPLTLENDWSLAGPDEIGDRLGLTSDQKADTLCLALGCDFYCA